MQFRDHKVFRRALKEFAIQKGFDYKLKNNDKFGITAFCKKDWGWKIHSSMSNEKDLWQIKSFYDTQNCGKHPENNKDFAEWIMKIYMETFRDEPDIVLGALQSRIIREHWVNVSIEKCCRAKKKALEMLRGKDYEQTEMLWQSCAAIKKWNPGSTILLHGEGGVFQRLYFCLPACKERFLAGCRPFIGIDGCHLKGIFRGQLLVAIGKDANDNFFSICGC